MNLSLESIAVTIPKIDSWIVVFFNDGSNSNRFVIDRGLEFVNKNMGVVL